MSVNSSPKKQKTAFKISKDVILEFKNLNQSKGKFLRINYKRNLLSYPRLAIHLSKKNIALAVNRNKIRRKIRQDFNITKEKFKKFDILVSTIKKLDAENISISDILMQEWLKLKKLLLK
ncbi:MAG: ribonuclease P protein component [Gammaproteobacteria bacterium]|nr:ribonuclease P protein component [Gammaproteobacteria bacterium]